MNYMLQLIRNFSFNLCYVYCLHETHMLRKPRHSNCNLRLPVAWHKFPSAGMCQERGVTCSAQ